MPTEVACFPLELTLSRQTREGLSAAASVAHGPVCCGRHRHLGVPEDLFNPNHDKLGRFTTKSVHVSGGALPTALEGKRIFMRSYGLDPHGIPLESVRVNPEKAKEYARYWLDHPGTITPEVRRAYRQLAKETQEQYDFITKRLGIKVDVLDRDPYPDVESMVRDVRENKHLAVLGTHVTGSHPLFSDRENDMFRAVHDFFGHAAVGRGFDRHGEEAAYLSHSEMFRDPLAVRALASETRGQNSVLTVGKLLGRTDGGFADEQKAILMPEEMTRPYHAITADGQNLEDVPQKTGAGGHPQLYSSGTGRFVRTETEELTITEPLEFYDPLQPRDKDGKWANSGGRSSSPLREGHEIPTRQPSKGGVSMAEGHETTKWDEISDDGKKKMVERLKKVDAPGFNGANTPDEVVDAMKKNILDVYDQVHPQDAADWKQWYVGANKIAGDLSAQYPSMDHDTVSAVIARLSPQKDWDMNVAQAHSLIDAMHKDWKITPDLAGRVSVLKGEAAERSGKGVSGKESPLNLDPHEHMGLVGKKLSELSDEQIAWAVRANDPNPANKAVRVHADGSYSIDPNTEGRPRTAWQSYQNIMSAVRIIRNPTKETISKELGKEHKVRSFFNNINNPHSKREDVTVDTHHYGISLGIPVGTNHPLISSGSRNITSSGGTVKDGVRGTYALVAEATRRAARERGIEPREMQSVTWEQWRRAYPAKSRSRGAAARAEAAAIQYDADVAGGMPPTKARAKLQAARADAMKFAEKYAPKPGEYDVAEAA